MPATQSQTIEDLRAQLRSSEPKTDNREVVTTDFPTLNCLLPDKGIRAGSVVEWVSDGPGKRATTIAFAVARRFLDEPGAIAVVDPLHCLCTAAIPQLGIPLTRLMMIRPSAGRIHSTSTFVSDYRLSADVRADALWALEQLSRCTGVRVVLAWIDRLSSTVQRRLQLAVERSGTTVFLMRPASALAQTTWADLRFLIRSQSTDPADTVERQLPDSPMRITLVRSRNSVHKHGNTLMEYEHETGVVSEIQ